MSSNQRKLYFVPIGRLGNNIIQYMAAKLLCRAFGHELVQWRSETENPVEIQDSGEGEYGFSWRWFCEFVLENGLDSLRSHPLSRRDIYLSGFFQQSDIYCAHREWLLKFFTKENKEHLNYNVRVCDLMSAAPRKQKEGTITVHLRMGDFGPRILHPRVFLQPLRKLMPAPVEIVTAPIQSKEEQMYLDLFYSVGATVLSGSELEDHATLRCAEILFCSNSTFAWTAAFLGDVTKRYMPITNCFSDTQNLGIISKEDHILETEFIDLDIFKVPKFPLALSGELFQSLCDAIIINKEKRNYHRLLDKYVSKEKWLFLEELWNPQPHVQTLCIYADAVPESCSRITKDLFPNLKVLMIHNGDTEPCEKTMKLMLTRFEDLEIYAQNNVSSHPQIHSLPMGIQNEMWREYTLENSPHLEKEYFAFASHFGATHPVRKELSEWLSSHPFSGLFVSGRCNQLEYWKRIMNSYFTFCPPGNAHDTHRLWESFFCGSIPIVLRDPFIEMLLKICPDLPVVAVDSFCVGDYETFLKKHVGKFKDIPSCLYLDYWKHLFDTYRTRAQA